MLERRSIPQIRSRIKRVKRTSRLQKPTLKNSYCIAISSYDGGKPTRRCSDRSSISYRSLQPTSVERRVPDVSRCRRGARARAPGGNYGSSPFTQFGVGRAGNAAPCGSPFSRNRSFRERVAHVSARSRAVKPVLSLSLSLSLLSRLPSVAPRGRLALAVLASRTPVDSPCSHLAPATCRVVGSSECTYARSLVWHYPPNTVHSTVSRLY